MTHTMPHGRFTWNDQEKGTPDGPLDTLEQPIQPLYDNLTNHFTVRGDRHAGGTPSDPHRNMEYRTRAVDNQVSAITNLHVEHEHDAPGSETADHAWGDFGFTTVSEENGDEREIKGSGYGVSQQDPDSSYQTTKGINYDSMIYSWTSPGFHSFSMDDRHENARIRIRTTSGHQIIMDDTNERIYVSTAGGETWIELDQAGNIDIYASKDISTHAGGDINFTTDKTFRVQAQEGIHMISNDTFRVHAYGQMHFRGEDTLHWEQIKKADYLFHDDLWIRTIKDSHFFTHKILYIESLDDMNVRTNANLFLESVDNTDFNVGTTLAISSGTSTDFNVGTSMAISSGTTMDINTGSVARWTSGGEMHHLSGSTMYFTGGSDIHLNGPSAMSATPAASAAPTPPASRAVPAFFAYYTARVPEHEPWARIYSHPKDADKDPAPNSFSPKPVTYTDATVGKVDRDGGSFGRNPLWHR